MNAYFQGCDKFNSGSPRSCFSCPRGNPDASTEPSKAAPPLDLAKVIHGITYALELLDNYGGAKINTAKYILKDCLDELRTALWMDWNRWT